MSLSKLESIPNEILIDTVEEYINGVDMLVALAYQLNSRIDALIAGCQRLRFDFINCRKVDFRLCIGLLPAYIEKIEELALSEQNTPGQIHAFLSFFPSFAPFKRLRKLYFHYNATAVVPWLVESALQSLSETVVQTLSIEITDAQETFPFERVITDIFRLTTLKKLSFTCDSYRTRWSFLNTVSSNIEHLTISGIVCNLEDLDFVFRCASALKYLNIRVTNNGRFLRVRSVKRSKKEIILMPMLRTVVFDFNEYPRIEFDMFVEYLKGMTGLRRLEVKAHRSLLDADAWEKFLRTSMPTLTYLTLETDKSDLNEADLQNLLESYQTPFWMERKNFNVLITEQIPLDSNRFAINKMPHHGPNRLTQTVTQWWMGPLRGPNSNFSPMNTISSLGLSATSSSLSQHYSLDNVNHLILYDLNDEILESMKKYMNCSRIKYLDISLLTERSNTIASLLSCIKSISSLRIKFNQMINYHSDNLGPGNCLKYLDISSDQHDFDEKDIRTIVQLFPNIEHFAINTQYLRNIPMLKSPLLHLRSLTFRIINADFSILSDDYAGKMWDENLRQQTQFLFQRKENWITVWIDQNALDEPYWNTFNTNSFQSMDSSVIAHYDSFLSFFD